MLSLFLVFFSLPCLSFCQSSTPFITAYYIANAVNGEVNRRITKYDVISPSFPWTIVLNLTAPAETLTYENPFQVVRNIAPYPLTGFSNATKFVPLDLSTGEHQVSAFANNMNKYVIPYSFFVDLTLPDRGPLPWDVIPVPIEGHGSMGIPNPQEGCERGNDEFKILSVDPSESPYDSQQIQSFITIDWCSGMHAVRVRLMRYERKLLENRTFVDQSTVMQQIRATEVEFNVDVFHYKECQPYYYYIEACVKSSSYEIFCDTSSLKRVPSRQVPEPRIRYRPPIVIEMAPGDSIMIRNEIKVQVEDLDEETESLSNGGFDIHGISFELQGVVMNQSGSTRVLPWNFTDFVDIDLNNVSLSDNGTEVFSRYKDPECPERSDSWRGRYSTKIIVTNIVSGLEKQDERLPRFEQPFYPITPFGEQVTLRVNAVNEGGGRRKDGSSTSLHYQWYLRDQDSLMKTRTYAEPIPGATGNTLKIIATKCGGYVNCGRWGCHDLGILFVDVCNTYGCKRSEGILPNVTAPTFVPEGMVWDKYSCSLQNM